MQVLRFEDMSAEERDELIAVGSNPSLALFMIVAGSLGLPGLIDSCRTRSVPADLAAQLATAGLAAEKLPKAEDAERFLMGLRVYVRMRPVRIEVKRKGKKRPLVRWEPGRSRPDVCAELKLTDAEAAACIRAYCQITDKEPP